MSYLHIKRIAQDFFVSATQVAVLPQQNRPRLSPRPGARWWAGREAVAASPGRAVSLARSGDSPRSWPFVHLLGPLWLLGSVVVVLTFAKVINLMELSFLI